MHANNPTIKAATNPNNSGKLSADENKISPETMSFIIFPKIKGTTIKNENRADFSLSTPSKTEVEFVAPDLEIPGKIAIA